MKIHKINLNSFVDIEKINLAIGNFDGLHLGHQKIINILTNESKKINIECAIMSFSPHPRKFFSKNYNNFNIISDNYKVNLLKKFGIDHYISMNFDDSLSSLNADNFIEEILVKKLNINNLFIGEDFKFGKDRKGNVNILKEKSLIYNYEVKVIEVEKSKKNSEIISSSSIRNCINEGNFENVSQLLGRNWSISGIVVEGDKRASKMNFPTANILPPDLIQPKKGVYTVKAIYEEKTYNGIANFGERPTVEGNKLLLEVHLFAFDKNIYGKNLTVEFLTFIREEKKFENFEILVQQIHKDIQLAKNYHSKNENGI